MTGNWYIAYKAGGRLVKRITMNVVEITDEDRYVDIAQKIYSGFIVGQSCRVRGFIHCSEDNGDTTVVRMKGDMVIRELTRLYNLENTYTSQGKVRRKHKELPNTIGGTLAHKMWKFEKRIMDNEPFFTIWRIQ